MTVPLLGFESRAHLLQCHPRLGTLTGNAEGDYFIVDPMDPSPTAGSIRRASDREIYQFDAYAGYAP
jgi:hypothetical protein